MHARIAILSGVRTPFCKAGGALAGVAADDQGAIVVKELLARTELRASDIDEVVFGNVGQPAHAANIARVIALKAGIPQDVVAYTVHHNCASGMQAVSTAAMQILTGRASIVVAGGTECMSQIPLMYGPKFTGLFMKLARAKTLRQRLAAIATFRPSFLKPVIALQLGLTDPTNGLNMGETAEILAREFSISRSEQDAFALHSHEKALAARAAGRHVAETTPLVVPPKYRAVVDADDGPREGISEEKLAKLRPYFNRDAGTVTVGNACPITDGTAAVIMTSERTARSLGITPLGYLSAWDYAALDGRRMGLGPVYATSRLLARTKLTMDDFDLVELNEAFAAQVIANERAFASDAFAREHLGRKKALGAIDPERLNVNGGAIALGHPVGATGTRLLVTLLHELHRRDARRGLATLCVGGGQGASMILEAA